MTPDIIFTSHPNAPLRTGVTNSFALTALIPQPVIDKGMGDRKKISVVNDSDYLCHLQVFNVATNSSYTVPLPARTAQNSPAFLYENPGTQAFVGTVSVVSPTTFTAAVAATGTVTLDTGASGSVDGITVGGIEIMSGAEAFDTSLAQTATNVAANITANTSAPNYSAIAVGAAITITAPATGIQFNALAVVSSVTTITTTDVNMGNDVLGVDGEAILITEYKS